MTITHCHITYAAHIYTCTQVIHTRKDNKEAARFVDEQLDLGGRVGELLLIASGMEFSKQSQIYKYNQ